MPDGAFNITLRAAKDDARNMRKAINRIAKREAAQILR